jgi:hypothetical protein
MNQLVTLVMKLLTEVTPHINAHVKQDIMNSKTTVPHAAMTVPNVTIVTNVPFAHQEDH